ncbi:hypothetical protein [Amycolatopsis sp.]|uniref:hypothetical protein n=1 Tax=Amycolatopsis sp. TaxID=37632 RepID=UPI002605AD46|nr:hypothetical protein [Amycolatopsis sp.]
MSAQLLAANLHGDVHGVDVRRWSGADASPFLIDLVAGLAMAAAVLGATTVHLRLARTKLDAAFARSAAIAACKPPSYA